MLTTQGALVVLASPFGPSRKIPQGMGDTTWPVSRALRRASPLAACPTTGTGNPGESAFSNSRWVTSFPSGLRTSMVQWPCTWIPSDWPFGAGRLADELCAPAVLVARADSAGPAPGEVAGVAA